MRRAYQRYPLDKPHPAFKGQSDILVPELLVRVGTGHVRTPRFPAVVDSGSPYCMFKAEVGELVGIRVEKGIEHVIGGIIHGPQEPIYFHRVKVYIEMDWVIDVLAGFVKKLGVTGILGRNGFFDNFHVHFDHSAYPPTLEVRKIEKVQ